jgi:hypothetical protein
LGIFAGACVHSKECTVGAWGCKAWVLASQCWDPWWQQGKAFSFVAEGQLVNLVELSIWLCLFRFFRMKNKTHLKVFWMMQVVLPKILEWYSRELVINSAVLLEWVCQTVPGKLEAQIRQCIKNQKSNRSPAHCLQWMPHNFGFRYIFVHDLARRISPFDSWHTLVIKYCCWFFL